MKWLDSSPVKLLNFVASLASILAAAGGAVLFEQSKGTDWGSVVAMTVGALLGLLVVSLFYAGLLIVPLLRRRDCPYCGGTGRTMDFQVGNVVCWRRCEVCGGQGKVW